MLIAASRKAFFLCDPPDPPDNNKTEDNVAAGAVGAAGVSTFKPGAENGAAEATLEGEGANAGGKTVDGDKKEDEGKQADLEGELPPTHSYMPGIRNNVHPISSTLYHADHGQFLPNLTVH